MCWRSWLKLVEVWFKFAFILFSCSQILIVSTLWTCSSNNRQWKKKMMKPNVKRCIEEYSYRCATFGCLRTLRDKMCIGGDLKLVWERTSYMYLSSERTLCEWKLTFPTTLLLVSLHKLMHFHKWTSKIKVAKNS